MKIEAIDKDSGQIVSLNSVHQLVVRDEFGNVLCVAVDYADAVLCSRLGDSDFDRVTTNLGIANTVVVREFKLPNS